MRTKAARNRSQVVGSANGDGVREGMHPRLRVPRCRITGYGCGHQKPNQAAKHSDGRDYAPSAGAQALPVGELGEGHRQELLPAGEAPGPVFGVVAFHQAAVAKLAARQVVGQPQENDLFLVHVVLPSVRLHHNRQSGGSAQVADKG